MPNNVVLHVGDSFTPEKGYYDSSWSIPFRDYCTYTLLRVNVTITQGEFPGESSVEIEESDEGTYYVFKEHNNENGKDNYPGINEMMGVYGLEMIVFEATATSDGLYVTTTGETYSLEVHEP